MLAKLKYLIKKNLFLYTLNKHKSTMFINQARKYSNHLNYCQKKSKISIPSYLKLTEYSKEFEKKGCTFFSTQNSQIIADSILKKIKLEEKKTNKVWDQNGRYTKGDIFKKFPEITKLFESDIQEFVQGV